MEHKDLLQEINEQKARGVLLVLTGPSGAGKDSVIAELKKRHPHMNWVVTTTSRPMREGESEGHPYHFVSREEFERLIAEDAFFEWVEFRGQLYGTQEQTLLNAMKSGQDVVWKIEMKGVKNIKRKMKETIERSVFVFLTADSLDAMKQRVYTAMGEEQAQIRWNESLVVWEMKQYKDCDYLVINRDTFLEDTLEQIEAIIEAKRLEVLPEKTI